MRGLRHTAAQLGPVPVALTAPRTPTLARGLPRCAGGSLLSRIEHVNDMAPSRLVLLRFLERVQERDLARTRRWIADEVRQEAERQRGVQARPPAPEWLLEVGLNRHAPPVFVHVGDCWMAGKRSRAISRDQARGRSPTGSRPVGSASPIRPWGCWIRHCVVAVPSSSRQPSSWSSPPPFSWQRSSSSAARARRRPRRGKPWPAGRTH